VKKRIGVSAFGRVGVLEIYDALPINCRKKAESKETVGTRFAKEAAEYSGAARNILLPEPPSATNL
jgi:hypothetical protein